MPFFRPIGLGVGVSKSNDSDLRQPIWGEVVPSITTSGTDIIWYDELPIVEWKDIPIVVARIPKRFTRAGWTW